jgi:hypothetical protein
MAISLNLEISQATDLIHWPDYKQALNNATRQLYLKLLLFSEQIKAFKVKVIRRTDDTKFHEM